jgi:hypothetical protein
MCNQSRRLERIYLFCAPEERKKSLFYWNCAKTTCIRYKICLNEQVHITGIFLLTAELCVTFGLALCATLFLNLICLHSTVSPTSNFIPNTPIQLLTHLLKYIHNKENWNPMDKISFHYEFMLNAHNSHQIKKKKNALVQ